MNQRLLYALALAAGLLGSTGARAQTDPATVPADSLNFDDFGSADEKAGKAYATQKVLYLSPTKLISVGYEAQVPFDITSNGPLEGPGSINSRTSTQRMDRFRGVRLGFNAPVISRSSFILNLGLTYWNTSVSGDNFDSSSLLSALNRGLRSTGANATVFKPLDDKHYLLLQANADLNGNYRDFDQIDNKGLTYSGTAIYGWKRNDNFMWGLGVSRTYRAGQLLYVPVLLYNRTFNPKWGTEIVFPARAAVRRSFGTTALLTFGYELEGNAYYLGRINAGQDVYLRRGELKPRLTYERQLAGFVWLSAQVGYRYNWRFDAFSTQNPKGDNNPVFENELTNPLYFNFSINLVSP